MPQQETSAPPPRIVTGSSQRPPLHIAGSRRYLDFGKCACKRHVPSRTLAGLGEQKANQAVRGQGASVSPKLRVFVDFLAANLVPPWKAKQTQLSGSVEKRL